MREVEPETFRVVIGARLLHVRTEDLPERFLEKMRRGMVFTGVFPVVAVRFEHDGNADSLISGGTYGTKFGRTVINEALVGYGEDGSIAGYVFSITNSNGYSGDIKLSLGIQSDGTLYGIEFTELNETPGKGSLWAESENKARFSGVPAQPLTLGGDGANGIDGITGATVTGKAVLNAVNAGIDLYNAAFAGGN